MTRKMMRIGSKASAKSTMGAAIVSKRTKARENRFCSKKGFMMIIRVLGRSSPYWDPENILPVNLENKSELPGTGCAACHFTSLPVHTTNQQAKCARSLLLRSAWQLFTVHG